MRTSNSITLFFIWKVRGDRKMTRIFNNLKEMKKYYDKKTNTYRFIENNKFIDEIIINFDLNIESNIVACNISATTITAKNIRAYSITAWEINACNINSSIINAGVIQARDIITSSINTMDIYARDIKAFGLISVNIYARDIVYTATCSAYEDFKCNSIKCGHQIPLHYSLYGKLEVTEK